MCRHNNFWTSLGSARGLDARTVVDVDGDAGAAQEFGRHGAADLDDNGLVGEGLLAVGGGEARSTAVTGQRERTSRPAATVSTKSIKTSSLMGRSN